MLENVRGDTRCTWDTYLHVKTGKSYGESYPADISSCSAYIACKPSTRETRWWSRVHLDCGGNIARWRCCRARWKCIGVYFWCRWLSDFLSGKIIITCFAKGLLPRTCWGLYAWAMRKESAMKKIWVNWLDGMRMNLWPRASLRVEWPGNYLVVDNVQNFELLLLFIHFLKRRTLGFGAARDSKNVLNMIIARNNIFVVFTWIIIYSWSAVQNTSDTDLTWRMKKLFPRI